MTVSLLCVLGVSSAHAHDCLCLIPQQFPEQTRLHISLARPQIWYDLMSTSTSLRFPGDLTEDVNVSIERVAPAYSNGAFLQTERL